MVHCTDDGYPMVQTRMKSLVQHKHIVGGFRSNVLKNFVTTTHVQNEVS